MSFDVCKKNSTLPNFDLCGCLKDSYEDYVEYFSLYYINHCILDNKPYITWPLLIIILLLSFYFLSTTGNDYLAETLAIISEKMKLSQNLAGLTLLALGNTAPDVAVAIVSGDDSDEGMTYPLSSVLGGGSMVFGFVLSSVVFLGKDVKVSGFTFIRDLMAYLIIVSFILIIGTTYKKMNLYIAIAIFGLYVLYVVLCVLMESKTKDDNDEIGKLGPNEDNKSIDGDEDDDKKNFKVELFGDDEENKNEQNQLLEIEEEKDKKETKIKNSDKDQNNQNNNNINDDEKIKEENKIKENNNISENGSIITENEQRVKGFRAVKILKQNVKNFNINDIMDAKYYGKIYKENENLYKSYSTELAKKKSDKYNYAIMRYFYLTKVSQWSEKSLFQKIIYVLIDFVFDLLRNLSIPPFEQKRYNQTMFILLPITIPLFLTLFFPSSFRLYTKSPECWFTLGYYILAICFAVFLKLNTYRTVLPKCEWVLLIFSLIMSMLWVMVVSNVLVQMIDDAKLLLPFEVNESFLAMTILAVGNSVPDFIVNCSLAKSGFAEMALSGCVGAPIFGMSVGFGLSLIFRFLKSDKKTDSQDFNLIDLSPISNVILCAMGGIILNLIQNMLFGFIQKFNIKRFNSYIGFTIFLCYLIGISIVSFVIKTNDNK